MEVSLFYDLSLFDKVSNILSADIWVSKDFSSEMLPLVEDPIKFSANVSIFIKDGEIEADLDLQPLHIVPPCVVNIKEGQILQIKNFKQSFVCSFMVMSKRFIDNLYLLLKDCRTYNFASRTTVIKIDSNQIESYEKFYTHLEELFLNKNNPYSYQAITLAIASFFLETAYLCFENYIHSMSHPGNRLPDKFIELVQQNFKKERFLEFYAQKLEVSTKHLSRTLKRCTGFTAVEWIDRYIILEAKVLLKSTNLNIQQIADELNFPSQSFFGKYFKKHVGFTPMEFRNC